MANSFPFRLLSNKNGSRSARLAEGKRNEAKTSAKLFTKERLQMGDLYPQTHSGVYDSPPTFPTSVYRWDAKKLTQNGIDIVSLIFSRSKCSTNS
jgi:hypothetical protein